MENTTHSAGKLCILGIQHVFAMFGATVLVPLLTGLDTSVALFAPAWAPSSFTCLPAGRCRYF